MYLYERGILENGKLSIRMILWYKMRVIEIQHDFFQVPRPLWTLIPVIRIVLRCPFIVICLPSAELVLPTVLLFSVHLAKHGTRQSEDSILLGFPKLLLHPTLQNMIKSSLVQ